MPNIQKIIIWILFELLWKEVSITLWIALFRLLYEIHLQLKTVIKIVVILMAPAFIFIFIYFRTEVTNKYFLWGTLEKALSTCIGLPRFR